MVHSFDIRDLPTLRALAPRGLCLDSQTGLTQDLHIFRSAVLAQLLPELIPETLILRRPNGAAGFVQLGHRLGDPSSRLRFLAPRELFPDDKGIELMEALTRTAGRRQAQHILADAEEKTEESGFLRRAGFSIYARQDIWKGTAPFPRPLSAPKEAFRPFLGADASAAHTLYCSIVPALVHQVEGFPRRPKGWMIYEEGELVGFFHQRSGPRGLWMEPIFHPGARNAAEWIAYWLSVLNLRPQDPVYVCVRSYQDWVGSILQDNGFSLLSRRAVFIRRVVVPVPLTESLPRAAVDKPIPQTTTYTTLVNRNAYDSATTHHR
ncbi:MAG: hypothetical protein JW748_08185 [Anaerolineales bacterium]|nr:hypothetical protein [Anaerolineales bacterium]